MKRTLIFFSAAVFIFSIASYWNPEKEEWKLIQLTECEHCSSGLPRVSATGAMVFFISTCDFEQRNQDNNTEVFRWEAGRISQLTQTELCTIKDLSLSPDARRMAFATNCELDGKNPGRGLEIAYMDGPDEVRVLTRGHGYSSGKPSWSADGKMLVFESYADLSGNNPDLSQEIFLAEFSNSPPRVRQLSNTKNPGKCERPQIGGGAIVCRCDDDLPGTSAPLELDGLAVTVEGRTVGGNPDRNFELISFSLSGKPRQLTRTQACDNGPPALHPLGSVIVFVSDCDFEGKKQPKELGAGASMYFLTTEVSRAFPDLDLNASALAWSGDGSHLAISSPWGRHTVNTERNQEIFMILVRAKGTDAPEATGPAPSRVTDFPYGVSAQPHLNKDGKVIVFTSNANHNRRNDDGGSEVFMAVREVGEE
jgi:Tol biopolymer transport system component